MVWDGPVNICTYRVKEGAREQFIELLRKHWPTLRKAGLASATPAMHFEFVPTDESGRHEESGPTFLEIFAWSRPDGADLAHKSPEVMAVWEPMGALVEERDGRPSMEFPMFKPLHLV
jgi:hypothetical protein